MIFSVIGVLMHVLLRPDSALRCIGLGIEVGIFEVVLASIPSTNARRLNLARWRKVSSSPPIKVLTNE